MWLTCSSFVSYSTSQYKLHYYETPTNIKFVMLTDLKSPSMRIALQQIYINLFVEYGEFMPELLLAFWCFLQLLSFPVLHSNLLLRIQS